jgi:hypothetical protein
MKGSSISGRTLVRAVWLLVMAVCLTWQQKQQASTTAAQWLDPAAAAAHHMCCLQALMASLVVPDIDMATSQRCFELAQIAAWLPICSSQ